MGDPVELENGHSRQDQRFTYDALRARCAVAREDGKWVALRHAEVVAAATDAETSPAGSLHVVSSPTVSMAATMLPTAPSSTAT